MRDRGIVRKVSVLSVLQSKVATRECYGRGNRTLKDTGWDASNKAPYHFATADESSC